MNTGSRTSEIKIVFIKNILMKIPNILFVYTALSTSSRTSGKYLDILKINLLKTAGVSQPTHNCDFKINKEKLRRGRAV